MDGASSVAKPESYPWRDEHYAERLRNELRRHKDLLAQYRASAGAARAEDSITPEEYEGLFDLGPLACFLLDANGVVRRSNLAGAAFLETSRARLIQVPLMIFVAEMHRRAFLDHMRRCRNSNQTVKTELVFRTRGGTDLPVELSSRVLPVPHAHFRAYHTTAVDLRDRHRLERERQRAADLRQRAEQEREVLRAANDAKDRFLAMLSHELRTPLTPVLLAASAWKDDATLPEPLRDTLGMIHRNVGAEARLIDDLLDLTRVMQGKLSVRQEPLESGALIEEVVDGLAAEVTAAGLTITLELTARRPVFGDPVRVRQIVWNLLRNAIRYTPAGGRIVVTTRDVAPDRVILSVTDTGIGFEPESAPALFVPFQQGARSATHGGLGLGLAITKGLVEAHGGAIEASSDGANRGARFVVTLPAAARAAPPTPERPEPSASAPAHLTILLVEDHEDTGAALSWVLRHEGYTVELAHSVAEALEVANRKTIDVLVSDLGLPDGSGLEVMRALRAHRPVRGIALTGFGRREDLAQTRDAGFECHLTKPVDLPTLLAAIEELRSPSPAS